MDDDLKLTDILSYIAMLGEAERELMRLFRVDEALVILDVGACEGEDSIRYARRFPASHIYSFEPLPANIELIRANFERFGVRNAEIVPIALSDYQGEANFHVSSGKPDELYAGSDWNYGNKSSSLLAPASNKPIYGWIEFRETVTVKTNTLDNFCQSRRIERIDFIHMDVQGAEYLVLSGAEKMLSHTLAIWLEVADERLYAGQKIRKEIEDFLRSRGFWLGFELRREVEGDQFYVNRRFARAWPYIARRCLGTGLRTARRIAGGWKRSILEPTSR